MTKVFTLLAILLILSGILLLAVPREERRAASPGLAPQALPSPTVVSRARDIAEQLNAPLSILFGLMSLVYSRRSYIANRERADAAKAAAGLHR